MASASLDMFTEVEECIGAISENADIAPVVLLLIRALTDGKVPPARMISAIVNVQKIGNDDDWLEMLASSGAYPAVDIKQQAARAKIWCNTNGRKFTRRMFVNWLNKEADRNRVITINRSQPCALPTSPPQLKRLLPPK